MSCEHGGYCPDCLPEYPQSHPAMRVARNIVNQLFDLTDMDVPTRQGLNDYCDQWVAGLIEKYADDRSQA